MVNRPLPILKPQPFMVGVFSCLIALVPANACRLLQSLKVAIPRSLKQARSPQGARLSYYISMGYARTNQAVGLQHRVAKETACVVFCR